jgi:hypothetical protein
MTGYTCIRRIRTAPISRSSFPGLSLSRSFLRCFPGALTLAATACYGSDILMVLNPLW